MKNKKNQFIFLGLFLTFVIGIVTFQIYKEIKFEGQRQIASSKKIILIGLEGFSYETFQKAKIQLNLFSDFKITAKHIAPFPSFSDYSWNLLTHAQTVNGKRGQLNSPEAIYFDQSSQKVQNDVREYFRRINNPSYFMGAFHYSLNPQLQKLLRVPPEQIASKELESIKEGIIHSADKKIVSAIISSTSVEPTVDYLKELDQMLKDIKSDFNSQGIETEIILVSNVAQRERDLTAINLASTLSKYQFKISSKPNLNNEIASPALFSHNTATLYFKDLNQRISLIHSLQHEPWFSQAIFLDEKDDQHFLIKIFDKTSKADLTVYRKQEGYQFLYKTDGSGNPLGIPTQFHNTIISSDLAFRVTNDGPYPDSFFRLAQLAEESEFTMPDLLLTSDKDYTFADEIVEKIRNTTGALIKENSIAFISSDSEDRVLPSAIRTKDILDVLRIPANALFDNKERYTSQNLFFDFIHYSRYVLDLSSLQALFDVYHGTSAKGMDTVTMEDFDFSKVKRETDVTFRGMNKNKKSKEKSDRIVRMVASDTQSMEPPLLLKSYSSLYVLERAITKPLFPDLIDNRDEKKAAIWNTHRKEILEDHEKTREFAPTLFSEIFNERLLLYNFSQTIIPPLYNRLSEDREDITLVYIPGIYNAIFEGKIFTIGLDGLRNNLGVRIIIPPVRSTCSSKYNGEVILKYIKDDIAYRALRKQKKQKYFLLGYSKGGIDSLEAFVQDKEFVKKEILGLLTLASPLHGAAILKRSDVPLPVFDALTTEEIPDVCKRDEKASKSITPEALTQFYKNYQKELIGLTRYYSLSFNAKAQDSHYWMKATKMIAMYHEDNDGVVTLSSSRFPEEFNAINLGIVKADHLAGLIETNFPQEAFLEAIYYTLLELKAFDQNPKS